MKKSNSKPNLLVSNPQRIATNWISITITISMHPGFKPSKDRYKLFSVVENLKALHCVSNPQRIATNSFGWAKRCPNVPGFKPSKDRYKRPYGFGLGQTVTSFKPSKDRYKPSI